MPFPRNHISQRHLRKHSHRLFLGDIAREPSASSQQHQREAYAAEEKASILDQSAMEFVLIRQSPDAQPRMSCIQTSDVAGRVPLHPVFPRIRYQLVSESALPAIEP